MIHYATTKAIARLNRTAPAHQERKQSGIWLFLIVLSMASALATLPLAFPKISSMAEYVKHIADNEVNFR